MQNAPKQDTPVSPLPCCPAKGEFTVATLDQLIPFHSTANVLNTPWSWDALTAKQLLALVHETEDRVPFALAPAGVGLGTTDQVGAAPAGAVNPTNATATSTVTSRTLETTRPKPPRA